MNTHPLRKAVMINDHTSWINKKITTDSEFHLMNDDYEYNMSEFFSASKIETQMWMLFFAEMFENDPS